MYDEYVERGGCNVELNFKTLSNSENHLVHMIRSLESQIAELESISRKLSPLHELNGEIFFVNKAINSLSAEKEKIQLLANTLSKALYQYTRCEQRVLSYTEEIMYGQRRPNTHINQQSPKNPVRAFFEKNKIDVENDEVFIGGVGAATLISGLDTGYKSINKIHGWFSNKKKLEKLARMDPGKASEVRRKRILELNDFFEGRASTAKSTSTRFYNNYHKAKAKWIDDFTGGGAKSVLSWGGVTLTALGNAVGNINEAKSGEIGTGRAVMETITETAIDIGTGWVIGSAVAAGIATVVGSAPVLAVGAATAVVTFGLDWACKKITGSITGKEKGLTETASDLILDTGEAVVKGTKNVGSAISSFFKNGWSKLSNAF